MYIQPPTVMYCNQTVHTATNCYDFIQSVTVMIFVTLAKQKDKTGWRWCRWIETCCSAYGVCCIVYISSSSSVICQTTGPKPLPKRFLHIVRSTASSFNWQYPLLSLRSSSSYIYIYICCAPVGPDSNLHQPHGTYIKTVNFQRFPEGLVY